MKHFFKFSILAVIIILGFAPGCKKVPTDTSILVLNMPYYYGSNSMAPGKSYSTTSGDSISFSRASFYISGISLVNTSGLAVAVPGNILVTDSTNANIIVGSVPTGTYKSISFNVGLSADTNHIDPSNYASGPLAAQTPSMHFSTDVLGYIFMAVEGLVDSTTGASPNKAFSYHIGADSLLETINMPDHSVGSYSAFVATGTKLVTINIITDFSPLLQNINVYHQPVTNTADYPVLADSLAAHIPAMFRYQN
jgi:hypothetical protein